MRRLNSVYSVCQGLFYGTQGINGLTSVAITKTRLFIIMADFMAAKTKSFRWKNVICLLFLLETEIVGIR